MQIFKSIKYQSSTVVETEILPIAQMSLFDILTAWFIWKKRLHVIYILLCIILTFK